MPRKSSQPAARAAETVITTKAELGRQLGLGAEQVRRLANYADFPGGQNGPWVLAHVQSWRQSRPQGPQRSGAAGSQSENLARLAELTAMRRLQLAVEQHRRLKLENDRTEGSTLDRGAVEQWAAALVVELREGLLGIPGVVAQMLPDEQRELVRAEVERHICGALTMIHRRLREVPDHDSLTGARSPLAEGDATG